GATAGVFGTFARRDQPKEQLAGHLTAPGIQIVVEFFGTAGQRANYAAAAAVSVQSQGAAHATLDKFGQRVFEQRQCAGLLTNIRDNGVDQARFELEADALRRDRDGLAEFVRVQRQDNLGPLADQVAKIRV